MTRSIHAKRSSAFYLVRFQVATLGDLSDLLSDRFLAVVPSPAPLPPTPDDLAEDGVDIRFESVITARAAQLDHHPSKIFEWVRNTIEYQPYSGSLKGAVQTLREQEGNAVDIASLLIALFRASGFPARYVIGEVEVTKAQALNWLKVNDLVLAGELLASNDVPVTLILEEGQPVALRIFHVWVEAYLNFAFYRGLMPSESQGPKRWSPLDASFKSHQFRAGRDLLTEAAINVEEIQGILDAAIPPGETPDRVEQVQLDAAEGVVSQVMRQVSALNLMPAADGVIPTGRGEWTINPQRSGILPAAIPLKVVTRSQRVARLPDELHHSLRIQLSYWPYSLAQPEEQGGLNLMEIDLLVPTALVAGRQLTLSYRPARDEDQATLESFGYLGVPPYLVHLHPQLLLDGVRVGDAKIDEITMGLPEFLWYQLISPGQRQGEIVENVITAGSFYAFGLNLGAMPVNMVQERLKTLRARVQALPTSPTEGEILQDEILGASLMITALAYWAETDWVHRLAADPATMRWQRLPSMAIASRELLVTRFAGVPLALQGLRSGIDIDRDLMLPFSPRGDREAMRQWLFLASLRSSAFEHVILEQFGDVPTLLPESELVALVERLGLPVTTVLAAPVTVSAVKALLLSGEQGIPIYLLDQTNFATIRPRLAHRSETLTAMENAITAGHVVLIAERELEILDWQGSGYLEIDLETGAARSPITSGGNGGHSTVKVQISVTQLLDSGWTKPLVRDVVLNTLAMIAPMGEAFVSRIANVGLEALGAGGAALSSLMMNLAAAQQAVLDQAHALAQLSALTDRVLQALTASRPRPFIVGAPVTLTLTVVEGVRNHRVVVEQAQQVIAESTERTVRFTAQVAGFVRVELFDGLNLVGEAYAFPVVRIHIVRADVTQDSIEIELGPPDQAGTLTIELIGDNSLHRIISDSLRVGSTTPLHETFDIPKLPEGKYTKVKATWVTGEASESAELDYRIKVLGVYRHSQYNTPGEDMCKGPDVKAYITTEDASGKSQCFAKGQFTETTLRSQFISQVDVNNTGRSINFGDVRRDSFCPGTPGAPEDALRITFRQTTIRPACRGGTVGDKTVAVRPRHPDLNCGDQVFIHSVGLKTVTDSCPTCPRNLAPGVVDQLDNYTTDSRCSGISDLGNFMTIKVFP
ncbi:MAG: transglutaminase domain-containing protein [Candidatus Tectomicrobia bacterium]|nr:transglutaminase domain-containing protein [Candidatus Tectomicrobia bacterium]